MSAAAWASFEMAPSQPWSVGGTLAMIETDSPELPPVVPVSPAAAVVDAESSSSSPMQAVTPIASTNPAATEMNSRFRDIAYLLVC